MKNGLFYVVLDLLCFKMGSKVTTLVYIFGGGKKISLRIRFSSRFCLIICQGPPTDFKKLKMSYKHE